MSAPPLQVKLYIVSKEMTAKCKNGAEDIYCITVSSLGHSSSSAMSPFDRAHTTSYSSVIETLRPPCTVFEIRRVICRNLPTLPYSTCIWRPRWGDRFEFHQSLWYQKFRFPYDVVCLVLHLAILAELLLATDGQTKHTQRH